MLEGTKKAPVHLGASALIGRFVIADLALKLHSLVSIPYRKVRNEMLIYNPDKDMRFQSLIGRFVTNCFRCLY